MKSYPLAVEPMHENEGGPLLGWYSKGHHDDADFRYAMEDYEGEGAGEGKAIHRLWWRVVPDGELGGAGVLWPAAAGARGAFPVTVMDR